MADQRELYEVQWTLFASNKNPERKISYSDVPWPGISTSPADIVQVVLYGSSVSANIAACLFELKSVIYD